VKLRLFLTCWIVFSLHFATNVVREHYPAFTLIDQGDFVCDRYAGFHSDIFKHTDGHWYIGNNVMGSVIAAVPLAIFDPVLDHLEERRLAEGPPKDVKESEYETRYPNRARFFKLVRKNGLDLRFGASTVITSVFLMAPLSALLVVLMSGVLLSRGVAQGKAAWLAILFGLGTPVFYRAAYLNHNVFLLAVVFGAFLCVRTEGAASPSHRRRFWGGFLAGMALSLDYAGVIPLLLVFGYLILTERGRLGWAGAIRSGVPFVLGSVPPVLFLWGSQYGMYGHPFLPGQVWMRDVNFTDRGWRGFGLPDWEVFVANLFSLDYGLYAFAPVLLIGLLPAGRFAQVLSPPERRFVAAFLAAFLVFCAANQYSRMQWNTGFRYLLPLLPFVFLQAADHLRRLPTVALGAVVVFSVVHEWVLAMHRYTPPDRLDPADQDPSTIVGSWRLFAEEGVDFPWLQVVRRTSSIQIEMMGTTWFPYLLLAVVAAAIGIIWRWPRRSPTTSGS